MGDIIRPGNVPMKVSAEVIGTAPLERVDVLHGTTVVKTVRPFTDSDLGRRVRVLWQGAEYRGRGREVIWQGKLTVTGNRIARFAPGSAVTTEPKNSGPMTRRPPSVRRTPTAAVYVSSLPMFDVPSCSCFARYA